MAADKDKEEFEKTKSKAEKGDQVAQYNLGFMYHNGDGVLEDDVTAYAWFNIAAFDGNATTKKNKKLQVKEMSAEQIAEAQKLSKEMLNKNPKLKN